MIRVADYIMDFLVDNKINDLFLISGGGAKILDDAAGKQQDLNYWCNHHEQATAMSVEAYSKIKGMGAGLITSGPGVTNTLTGVFGAWTDSTPCIFISGGVGSNFAIGNSGLRQFGVQEANAEEIVKPLTKYSVMIKNPNEMKYHLEKAFYLAKSGRPGPVWLDIPLDIQRAEINPKELNGFIIPNEDPSFNLDEKILEVINLLKECKRPIIYLGQGIRLAGGIEELNKLLKKINAPIITSWSAADLIEDNNPLYVGRSGMFGQRAANFTIQNCDLLLSIGSRLSISQTGYNFKAFARKAKKIIVDIDNKEIIKPNVMANLPINCDARIFLEKLNKNLETDDKIFEWNEWNERCKLWKKRFPNILTEWRKEKIFVNSYVFIDELSNLLIDGEIIVTDMGTSFTGTYQSIKIKKNQRIITSSGAASMGFGIAASVGACIANNKKRVICISGEGGLQMNIQELQTIKHHNLPIKLFVINNNQYHTIVEALDRTMNRFYVGCNIQSGVSFPDIVKVAQAYGLSSFRINNHDDLKEGIKKALDMDGPVVVDVMMNPKQSLEPRMVSKMGKNGKKYVPGLEDMAPFISDEDMKENMIIPIYNGEE